MHRFDPHRPQPPDAGAVRLERPLELHELPTPALVIDLEAMDRNLGKAVHWLGHRGMATRPHTKTHKCPLIAHRQMQAGAVGVCCAKVSEAEVMARAGIDSILITSPVVTSDKCERVAELVRQGAGVAIVVDSDLSLRELEHAAARAGVCVPTLIDLDPGIHRTGIGFGEPALELAQQLHASESLALWGLQCYAGHLMHLEEHAARREKSHQIWEQATKTRGLIENAGISLPILTGGGTGTWDIDCELADISDLQIGSYLFMDREYGVIGGPNDGPFDAFENALFVLTTPISKSVPHLITVDAGYKAYGTDSLKPLLADHPGVTYHWGGDEHGILELDEAAQEAIALGTPLRVIPPHVDPCVNAHDGYFVLEGQQVREFWPIAARGRSQ